MECRPGCAACCIAPSIHTPMPSMPSGKLANEFCLHLDIELHCTLWGKKSYPQHCANFQASAENCGKSREQALEILRFWEEATL